MTLTAAGQIPAAASAADIPSPFPSIVAILDQGDGECGRSASAPGQPLTWLETSVAILALARRPLRARDIAAQAEKLGIAPATAGRTPWQSVNRVLHAAVRRGDPRVVAGPEPGQFRADDIPASAGGPLRRASAGTGSRRSARGAAGRPVTVDRLPIGPLLSAVSRAGGLTACGLGRQEGATREQRREVERLARAFQRGSKRGWLSVYDADELAVRVLRTHPCLIWGTQWWVEVTAAAGAESFSGEVPARGRAATDRSGLFAGELAS